MKSLALAGPFILWLVIAVPLNCRHGLTSLWAAAGHVHEGGASALDLASTSSEEPETGRFQPAFCEHQSSGAGAAVAYGMPDSALHSASNHVGLDRPQFMPARPDLAGPRGIAVSPPDKPPSHPA